MRIDAALIPQILGLAKPPLQKAGASFATLFSALPPQAGEAGNADKTVLPRNVFSFDALGTLGLGGLAGTGAPLKVGKAPHPETSSPPQAFATPVATAAPVVETSPVPEVLAATQPSRSSATAPSPGAPPPAGQVRATSNAPAVPLPADTVDPQAPVAAALARTLANARALTAEAPDEAPAARKAAPVLRFEAEVLSSSEGISVVVSETDGTLNVAAAASGLAESDRQALQKVAVETAGDAGIPLGELRLNGVAVRPFSKVS